MAVRVTVPVPVAVWWSWPLGCWDHGFESRSGHGCLSVVLSCVGRGLCDKPITRLNESYPASNKITETSNKKRRPWPNPGWSATGKEVSVTALSSKWYIYPAVQ
jgi:hypothetical protein